MDRRRFLRGGAAAALGCGAGAVITAAPASTSPRRPWTKARRGVGLGTQQVHWSVPQDQVRLTFDDGPYPAVTPTVLDILDRYGIPATFMLVGTFAAAHPDLVRRLVDRGHVIGNHSWTHPDLSTLEPAQVRDELHRTHDVHVTAARSRRVEGADWLDRVTAAMAALRTTPPAAVAGRAVVGVEDLLPGGRLPPSDVLIWTLEGARVVVRPSGTEPKLKSYVEAVVPAGDDLASARADATVTVQVVLDGVTDLLVALGL